MPAIPVHHTAVVDEPWDGPAAVAAMPADDTVLEYCHAWQTAEAAATPHKDGDKDADDTKGNYKFPHHKTKGGPAILSACHAIISSLAGGRTAPDIPSGDVAGVRAHAQAHIDDFTQKGSHAMFVPTRELRTATPLDVLRERRNALRGQRERRAQSVPRAQFEVRAKADGTGGTAFEFHGYAATFEQPFEMWDQWGDPYDEILGAGSCNRTLSNDCDTQFLIGHNEGGFALARTKSGTMKLSADSTGLDVFVPSLDGRSPMVQALASAMERGDMDEMSIGFICTQQEWSRDWMTRRVNEISLNRGDVSVVCWAANPNANGASMAALPISEAASRRAGIAREERADPGAEPDFSSKPPQNVAGHGDASLVCPNGECEAPNAQDAAYCDQCGTCLYDEGGLIKSGSVDDVVTDTSGLIEEEDMTLARQRRMRLLELRAR